MSAYRLSAFLVAAALLGAGCLSFWPESHTTTSTSTGTLQSGADIQFQPGDTFEIRQTVFGFGAFLPDFLQSKDGVRTVKIDRFAPFYHAGLTWTLTANEPSTSTGQLVKTSASGTITDINIQNTHSAYLPAYWEKGLHTLAGEKSAIWLSDDAFQELSRTGHTILNFGVFDEQANTAAKNLSDLKTTLNRLRNQAEEDGKYSDLTLLKADPKPIDWTITVNGKDMTVSAIQARNWFGEIVVLNNRQNPLILKMTLNPLTSAAADAATGNDNFLDKIYGYEVANIELKH